VVNKFLVWFLLQRGVFVEIIDFGARRQEAMDQVQAQPAERRLTAALYLHDLSPGGVERQSLVLARELRPRGIDVILVVHQLRGELVPLLPPDVPVVNLRSARTLQDIFRLRRFLLDRQPDIFMANVDHNNIAAALANSLARTATKLVIVQHNPLTADFHATVNWKHRVVPASYRALASRIDHAVAVSDGIARELVHHARLPSAKVSTILNAVIGDDFEARASAPLQHPWLLEKDRPVFVTAGRLVEMKDQRTLLRAFALYLREQRARLILLGSGPMLDELRDLAGCLGITDHVAFAGFVGNPLPFMRAADAFVLSSRSEGFGNVLVEAMGCGTPILSTDCPHGPADILSGGKYGVLVRPRDPSALAAGFGQVLQERPRWPKEQLRARASAFTYGACADSYARLFRSLIGVEAPALSA
jgi:glycosyltransferase involved in cell wall biosynthesis